MTDWLWLWKNGATIHGMKKNTVMAGTDADVGTQNMNTLKRTTRRTTVALSPSCAQEWCIDVVHRLRVKAVAGLAQVLYTNKQEDGSKKLTILHSSHSTSTIASPRPPHATRSHTPRLAKAHTVKHIRRELTHTPQDELFELTIWQYVVTSHIARQSRIGETSGPL